MNLDNPQPMMARTVEFLRRLRSPVVRVAAYSVLLIALVMIVGPVLAQAQNADPATNGESAAAENGQTGPPPDVEMSVRELFQAGGFIGMVIVGLSVAMVALIVEHLLSMRRQVLMPVGLAEEVHKRVMAGQFGEAVKLCREQPSFLSHVLAAGLSEAEVEYTAVDKAMEDAATEQASRLFRKVEYLSVIGSIGPMLGLLGTVWGMILAFRTFTFSANPQVAELAPSIATALVTTLFGLMVAIPALAAFAFFRNRIDELVAEASLTAEQVFADHRRQLAHRRRAIQKQRRQTEGAGG
jgi:biopolymer transport protein ExbB